eukprot:TRINITY_DN11199_c0_g4_i2.p1 TRINITY_DN11199_c0_g4~~TRINITY_DN11199_c0_g4_i2.p1  ORF type:complete len:191 (+),score=11.84 TRINITY_DN11199_c0_g4_i2:159-731(+)
MDVVLVPAGHTYVVYEEGDHLGHLLAYLTLLPLFIGFSLGVLVLVRRDIQTAMFLIGILANEISNYYLKHTIQEARPVRSAGKVVVKYGMPSSHAQFTGFFVAYMIMVVCYRIRLTRTAAPLWLSRLGQGVAAAGLAVMGLLIAYSRIHLHYHTSRQVYLVAVRRYLLVVCNYNLQLSVMHLCCRSLQAR